MKKIAVALSLTAGLFSFNAQAQLVVPTIKAVPLSSELTPSETMRDFMRAEESRVCSETRRFAEENILHNKDFLAAASERDTRAVEAAISRFAVGLAKDYNADFVFYHPNTRFFIRINDKNYRGRMRLPSSLGPSACYWERLPSQDVVYSVLMKIDGERSGYLKISTNLTRMIGNIPDLLSEFGDPHVYVALDKTGLRKMAWFKMRKREPNRMRGAGWCTTENLAFLSHVGSGKLLPPKSQKKLLALGDKNEDFLWAEKNVSGGSLPILGLDGERLAAVVYTLTTGEDILYITPGDMNKDDVEIFIRDDLDSLDEDCFDDTCFQDESAEEVAED